MYYLGLFFNRVIINKAIIIWVKKNFPMEIQRYHHLDFIF